MTTVRMAFERARDQLQLVENDYPAWQAAYCAALEEAAKVMCENCSSGQPDATKADFGKDAETSDFPIMSWQQKRLKYHACHKARSVQRCDANAIRNLAAKCKS